MSYQTELIGTNDYNSTNESTYFFDGSLENYSTETATTNESAESNESNYQSNYSSFNSVNDNYNQENYYNQAYYYNNGYNQCNYYANNNAYYQQYPTQKSIETPNYSNYNQEPELKQQQTEAIDVSLSNDSLWNKFNAHTTEMILTKQGRKMFPTLQYLIKGLNPTKKYNIFVDMVKTVPNSWKFQSGKWIQCQSQQVEEATNCVHMHPDSPSSGSFWMKNEVLFSKLKLTNNKAIANENTLLLNSMHKYQPRLHIVCLNETNCKISKPLLSNYDKNDIKTIYFKQTQFIAVTAYLNRNITELKIEYNPFAKGFREIEQQNDSSVKTSTTGSPTTVSARSPNAYTNGSLNTYSIGSASSPIGASLSPNNNSPNNSRIQQIHNASTPKLTHISNQYYFNQENLSPKPVYDFNSYYNSSLYSMGSEYKSNYYYNYNPAYNTSYNQNNNYLTTNGATTELSAAKTNNKRKYEETYQDNLDAYSNTLVEKSNRSKQYCSNSYNVLTNHSNYC